MFSLNERFEKKLTYERFADFLPYIAWDPGTGIYILNIGKESRIGWFFVCHPISSSSNMMHDLESLLSALPAKSTVQVALTATPHIGRLLGEYLRMRNKTRLSKRDGDLAEDNATILRYMLTEKIRLYTDMTKRSRSISFPYLVRQLLVYFSFTIPGSEASEGVKIRAKTEGTLRGAGFFPRMGNPCDLYDLLSFLFKNTKGITAPSEHIRTKQWMQGKKPRPAGSETFVPLFELLAPVDLAAKIEKDRIICDDNRTLISISYKHYPAETDPFLMNRILGDPSRAEMQLPLNFYHCFNIYIPEQSQARDKISRRHTVTAWQAFGPMAKFAPKMAKLRDELSDLMEKSSEQTLCEGYLHSIIVGADPDTVEDAASSYMAYAKRLNFYPVRDKFVLLPLLLNSLPMSLSPTEMPKLFRKRTLTSQMAATLSPVQGDGGQFGRPVFLFGTRRGFTFAGDIFASPTAYNGLVFGGTGGGKSFFLNELITSYFSVGGKAIVIDVGRSFTKLCSVLGGEYVEFGENSPINLNPFAHLSIENKEDLREEMEMLKNFTEIMCAPREGFSDYQKAALTEIFNKVIEKHGTETSFDSIAEELSRHRDQRMKDIATMLMPWMKNGENHRWIAGGRPINFDSDIMVIEMEELGARPFLRSIALYYLIYRVSHDFLQRTAKDPEFRKKPKFLFIDEAWELLRAGDVDFIERGYRRFRKTGSGIWIISQSPSDLEGTPITDAVWTNSQFIVSLSVDSFDKEKAETRLSKYAIELIPKLKTFVGEFSGIYFKSPFGEECLRFYAPRYTQLVYSTLHEEVAKIESYREKGLSYAEAVEKVMLEESRPVKNGNKK